MAIGVETIALNRYAPQGADAISLYSNGSAEGLTLAQLAISVCLQAASAYEGQSVVKMNILTRGAVKLDGAAQWMEKIDALTQQQQRDMIDMQTLVNRRDVAYSTSSNVVRTLGASQEADAANF